MCEHGVLIDLGDVGGDPSLMTGLGCEEGVVRCERLMAQSYMMERNE